MDRAEVYAVIEESTGQVVNTIKWDGLEEWSPVAGCIAIESTIAQIGWTYFEGVFSPPPQPEPTPEEALSRNTDTRDSLISAAALAIAPLQYAVDLDDATAEELSLLKRWKQYSVAVNRIDLNALDINWPALPV